MPCFGYLACNCCNEREILDTKKEPHSRLLFHVCDGVRVRRTMFRTSSGDLCIRLDMECRKCSRTASNSLTYKNRRHSMAVEGPSGCCHAIFLAVSFWNLSETGERIAAGVGATAGVVATGILGGALAALFPPAGAAIIIASGGVTGGAIGAVTDEQTGRHKEEDKKHMSSLIKSFKARSTCKSCSCRQLTVSRVVTEAKLTSRTSASTSTTVHSTRSWTSSSSTRRLATSSSAHRTPRAQKTISIHVDLPRRYDPGNPRHVEAARVLNLTRWLGLNPHLCLDFDDHGTRLVAPASLVVSLTIYFNEEDEGDYDRRCPTSVDFRKYTDGRYSGTHSMVRRGTGYRATTVPFYFKYHIWREYGSDLGLKFYQITCRKKTLTRVAVQDKTYTSVGLERVILVTQEQKGGEVSIFALQAYECGSDNGIKRNNGRVYVAYLDSTHHFDKGKLPKVGDNDPRRRFAKETILDAYANYVSALGFHKLYLWSCAPQAGQAYYLFKRDPSPREWEQVAKHGKEEARRLKQEALDAFYTRAFKTGFRRTPRWYSAQGPRVPLDNELEYPLFPGDFKLDAFKQGRKPGPASRFVVDLRGGRYGWYGKYYEIVRRIDFRNDVHQLLKPDGKNTDYTTATSARRATRKVLGKLHSVPKPLFASDIVVKPL